jgi:hypothetical protein|tara:strand:- start:83 stop:739 length:657 start_codon:yes stop_codon:yes gene_type:complete
MPRTDCNSEWGDYENETLIHNHKLAKVYKKRYQRASDFHNSLYRFLGLITVVSSAVTSTLSWGGYQDNNQGSLSNISNQEQVILSSIATISAVSAAIQNFYQFQENSNSYITTAKLYAKLQNKIESIGNIHPEYRCVKPKDFLKKIQDNFDQISDSRLEISNCMSKRLYNKKDDDESYLYDKHKKYKLLKEEEKLEYSLNDTISTINIQVDSDSENDN